jgi:hypothetical protein
MKHKMIHYKGYFLLALTFVFVAAILGTWNQAEPMPFFAIGIAFLVIGCVKTAMRNASLKTNDNS